MYRKLIHILIVLALIITSIGDQEQSHGILQKEGNISLDQPRKTSVLVPSVIYLHAPTLNQDIEIHLENIEAKVSYDWYCIQRPKGAVVQWVTSQKGSTNTILRVSKAGKYVLEIRREGEVAVRTTFVVRAPLFGFDRSKLEIDNPDQNLSEVEAVIRNQYWLYSKTLAENDLRKIAQRYHKHIRIIGYDDIEGLLIEFHRDKDIPIFSHKLEQEKGIDSVDIRIYRGKNHQYPSTRIPNDAGSFDDTGAQWHLKYIHMDKAWKLTTGSDELEIGVCDAGNYETKHEDLIGRFSEVILGTDHKEDHGTLVSGVIGAQTDNHTGIAGINWKTKINANVNTYGSLQKLVAKENVRLANNSWGFPWSKHPHFSPYIKKQRERRRQYSYNRSRRLRKLCEKYHDTLFVWSAGNGVDHQKKYKNIKNKNFGVDGKYSTPSMHYDTLSTLEKLDNLIVVAAIADKSGKLTFYSNYGKSVDIAAPTHFRSTDLDNKYEIFNGTSASAPVVTGVASLIYAIDKHFSAEEVKKILISSATEYATKRYIKPRSHSAERLKHKIPILDAGAAVEMADEIKKGVLKFSPTTGEIEENRREIHFETSPMLVDISAKQLRENSPYTIKIMVGDVEVPTETYRKYILEIDSDGVAFDLSTDAQGKKTIRFIPETSSCTSEEKVAKVHISLKKGALEHDHGSSKIEFTIQYQTSESLWCNIPQFDLPPLQPLWYLLSVMYLFGLFHKARFCSNQYIKTIKILLDDEETVISREKIRLYVPWWYRLIPFIAERASYQQMTFVAHHTCFSLYLSKKTQASIAINGNRIESAKEEHIKLYPGDKLSIHQHVLYCLE